MSASHRQVTGTRRSPERIRLPFAGKPVIKVLRDEDGRYYTDHPLLSGRFANRWQIGDKIRNLRDMLEFRNRPPLVMPPPSPVPSEKLVDGAGETASAPTLQEHTDDASSKEESTTAGPQTAPHDTINGSSSAFSSSCDKFLVGSTKPIPTVTELDHLDKLFIKLTNKFRGGSSEVSSTASPRTLPHNTTNDSLQSASSISRSTILIRHPPNCFQTFYIRMNRRGSFCTYPDVGGPFCTIHEADDAIKYFVDELRHRGRCKEQAAFSCGVMTEQDCKYFLDGPPIDPKLRRSKTTYDVERYLIEALLDHYNVDNNLFGDLAHLLEDLVRKQIFFEDLRWFYHFNFTTKQKANGGISSKLFFAEVSHMQGEKAWDVNYCRMINIGKNDGGGHCYGCKNMGDPLMKHPSDTSAFFGGHLDKSSPFFQLNKSDYDESSSDDDYGGDDGGDDDDDDDDDDCSFLVKGTRQTPPRVCTWLEHILWDS